MNNRVITVLALTIAALAVLTTYSFSPLAAATTGATVKPASLEPVPVAAPQQSVTMSAYHNRDRRENYYTIQFPQDWKVQAGGKGGSYAFSFDTGSGTAELVDVPDNSTLELFVQSQEEPKMKKQLAGYQQVTYQKTEVNSREACRLVYYSKNAAGEMQSMRTYIAGPDEAEVITFTVPRKDFSRLEPLFLTLTNTFQWESK
jgi:hypothetical protein